MLAYLEALCALLPVFQLPLVDLVDLEALCTLLPIFQLSLIDLVELTLLFICPISHTVPLA
jgi:hypothetical protein